MLCSPVVVSTGGEVQRDPKYEDAIQEMMRRIQSGGNLRSVPNKRDSQVNLRDSSASQTDMFAGQISRATSRTDTPTEKVRVLLPLAPVWR